MDIDFKDDDLAQYTREAAPKAPTVFKETCWKCGGDGIYKAPSTRGHACFACGGKGYHVYKTSAETRAKSRAAAATRRANKAAQEAERATAKAAEWGKQNPTEWEWLQARQEGFEFARSLMESLRKWGSLTVGQLAAVQKCIAKDAERKVEQAARAETAQSVNVEAIEVAFGNAKSAGIKWPKLRLADYVFSPAGANSRNPGAIYVKVKATDDYLGKVQGGKFFAMRGVSPEVEADVVAVASDPHNAAVAYGKKFGVCAVCGRELSDPASVARGIGPVCADNYGW